MEIIFWHTSANPRRTPLNPTTSNEDDLGAIKADREFLIERVSRLPTRKESSLQAALRDGRLCGVRHLLVRDILAALPLAAAAKGNRVAQFALAGINGPGQPYRSRF